MDNYSYTTASYAESGDSSPRSREIEYENPPPPWDEQHQQSGHSKIKLMCSYGGKILPRQHDNHLSYVGGETKILAVDRNVKFAGIVSKLSALCDAPVSFKYQLPGEDLDALISVTNDEDLEHMIHEYDRLCLASAKPARLRLFLFPVQPQSSFGSELKSDRDRFVDALNSGPVHVAPPQSTVAPPNHVDFLFGMEKGVPPPPAVATKIQDPIPETAALEREIPAAGFDDRSFGLEPMQKQIQDMQRLQIAGQLKEPAMHRRKSDDNIVGAFTGDYYVKKVPEIPPQATVPPTMSVPATISVPAGYWPEKQIAAGGVPATAPGVGAEQQPVYVIPAPASVYHAPVAGPMTVPAGQGYYAVQRMPPEIYREQPVYNVAAAPPTLPPQPLPRMGAYADGIGMVARPPISGGVGVTDTGYAQVAYDNGMGRQVYYTAPGGVVPPPYQAVAVTADMRPAGGLSQEGKVAAAKVSQASV